MYILFKITRASPRGCISNLKTFFFEMSTGRHDRQYDVCLCFLLLSFSCVTFCFLIIYFSTDFAFVLFFTITVVLLLFFSFSIAFTIVFTIVFCFYFKFIFPHV